MGNSRRMLSPSRRPVVVPTAAVRSDALSLEAIGLLCVLCSFNENEDLDVSQLLKLCGDSEEKYGRIVRELEDSGLLQITTGPVSDWIIEDPE